MIEVARQIAIAGFTGCGLWFVGYCDIRSQRRGFLLCICAQPFWIWETWARDQWGMFLVALGMTYIAIRGWWKRRTIWR